MMEDIGFDTYAVSYESVVIKSPSLNGLKRKSDSSQKSKKLRILEQGDFENSSRNIILASHPTPSSKFSMSLKLAASSSYTRIITSFIPTPPPQSLATIITTSTPLS